MPQRIPQTTGHTSTMKTFLKLALVVVLMAGSFAGGWFLNNQGYRVVNSEGSSLIKSNAVQLVKDENAKLGRDVIGKTEEEATALLVKNNRTLFVGNRNGVPQEYKGLKTFSNLTVEVKDGVVVKVMGWY